MIDKKYHNGSNITLNEKGKIITNASQLYGIFYDFFY